MTSVRGSRAVLLMIALLIVTLTLPAIVARPPPQPVCEVCTTSVVPAGAVEQSTVTISIDDRGAGEWLVRLDLRENVSIDRDRVRRAAESALTGHRGAATPRNLSVVVADNTVEFSYSIPAMAHHSVGDVLVVDYFDGPGDAGRWFGVNADTVLLRGPEATKLVHSPSFLQANESTASLSGRYGDVFALTHAADWHLAFATSAGHVGTALGGIGVWIDVAGPTVAAVPVLAGVPTILLAVALLTVWWQSKTARTSQRGWIGTTALMSVALLVVSILLLALTTSGGQAERIEAAAVSLLLAGAVTVPFIVASAIGLMAGTVLQGTRVGRLIGRETVERGAVAMGWVTIGGALPAAGFDGLLGAGYAVLAAFAVGVLFATIPVCRGRRRTTVGATILFGSAMLVLGLGPRGGASLFVRSAQYVPWALVVSSVGTALAIGPWSWQATRVE